MYNFYRKKGAVHISHSYIPMANWSQLDSPANLMTMVMVSSTKTCTVFPAIFMLVPAFSAQAAPSLHPSLRQLNSGHGEQHFLPASTSSAASVSVSSPPLPCLSSSCACPWLTGSSKLERFLLLTFQSTFQSFLCWERWGNRLSNSAFRSLALLWRLMSEDKPCSRAQREKNQRRLFNVEFNIKKEMLVLGN